MRPPQVILLPCKHDQYVDWKGSGDDLDYDELAGPGSECEGASGVEVICRIMGEHSIFHAQGGSVLRVPEHFGGLSAAALRAFSSLGMGP